MIAQLPRRIALTLAFVPAAACAQQARPASAGTVPSLAATVAAMPKNLPRAPGPGLDAAIAAARAAIAVCTARGERISVVIADTVGEPVAVLSGDGAGVRSRLIAQTKVNIVARFGMASAEVERRAKADPAIAAKAAADPGIGLLRAGGLPVSRSGKPLAIVGVSGASLVGGDLTLDETCARAAVASLEAP